MKEQITSFDLEAAFKALDDLDIPVASPGIKANRPALTEIFSRKSKFDALFEEYYDISSADELTDAKAAREAEVAKAKLARIEKIVDLDADSPEDLLTSYVGKYIIQCPQCMTLFYKAPEDVEKSEDDPTTVNVNEVCQHCGNDSGYTLIGKVGEATVDETSEQSDELNIEDELFAEEPDTDSTADEEDDNEDTLNLDLNGELEELPTGEDSETDTDDKKEEAFIGSSSDNQLFEQLTEDVDLDVSASEFEELISSPEFKKPVSDMAVRTMLSTENSSEDDEDLDESVAALYDQELIQDNIERILFYGKMLNTRWADADAKVEALGNSTYKLIHAKGQAAVIVKFDLESSTASNIVFKVDNKQFIAKQVSEAQNIILNELDAAYRKQFDIDLDECASTETLNEGIFDKIADSLKSRTAKADWILKNAREDYSNVQSDTQGRLVPDEDNKRFSAFLVIGFKDKYNNGKLITMAPSFNNKDLVMGMKRPEIKDRYKDADNIAKGWSMQPGCGPAFIYLIKDNKNDDAVFLCQYFKGELKNDQVEKYFKVVKDQLKGAKLMKKGGINQTSDDSADEVDETNNAKYIGKYEKNESIENVFSHVDELHESSIEKLISDYLVESCDDIAGFRLTSCDYINEQLSVNGTVYYTSGDNQKTSYIFTKARTKENKVSLYGLNESLDSTKQFTVVGKVEGNTFITESFNYTFR